MYVYIQRDKVKWKIYVYEYVMYCYNVWLV